MKWIKIKDQMPDEWKAVLVSNGKSVAIGVDESTSDMFFSKPDIENVTHWHEIELPENK